LKALVGVTENSSRILDDVDKNWEHCTTTKEDIDELVNAPWLTVKEFGDYYNIERVEEGILEFTKGHCESSLN